MDILGPFQVSTTNGSQTTLRIPTVRRLKMVSIVGKPTNSINGDGETLIFQLYITTRLPGTTVNYLQDLPIGDCIRSLPGINGHVGKIFFPRVPTMTNTNYEGIGVVGTYYVKKADTYDMANPVCPLIFGTVTMNIINSDTQGIPEGQYFDVCLGFE